MIRVGDRLALGRGQRLARRFGSKVVIEPARENRGPLVADPPQGRDNIRRSGREHCLSQAQLRGPADRVLAPRLASSRLATGKEHELAPNLEPEELMNLEPPVVVGST